MKIKSNMPTKVKIGWRDYQIENWAATDAVGADRYGETSHTGNLIRVCSLYGTRQAAQTLLHEICHGIFAVWTMSKDDDEERQVRILSQGLSAVWRDNPGVLAWIGEHLANGT